MNFAVSFDGESAQIYRKGQGLVLREPTPQGMIAFGRMIDTEAKRQFFRDLFKRVKEGTRQNCVFLIPCSLTTAELGEYKKVAYSALGEVEFIPRAVAAANFWGVLNKVSLIVDIYECGTEVCLVQDGSIIHGGTIDEGMGLMKEAIRGFVAQNHQLKITDDVAKTAIEEVGSLFTNMKTQITLRGVNLETAQHDEIIFTAQDAYDALSQIYNRISKAIQKVLSHAHIDTVAQVKTGNFFVSGSGSQILGLKEFFLETLNLKITTSENARNAAILGGGALLNDLSIIKSIVSKN